MPNDDTPGPSAAELELRASDTDRERVADVLREAAGQGRIDMDELEERLEAVYAAKTYGELLPITRDLPADGAAPRLGLSAPASPAAPAPSSGSLVVGTGAPARRGRAIAVMSGANRGGGWIVPRKFGAFAFWGGSVLDLREARFESQVTEITATAIMGGVQVLVPEGVRVEVHGIGLMGGFNESGDQPATSIGAPVVRVKGVAFWGGVLVRHVKRKKRDAKEVEA
jgi:Domain of unknown function (DUF1707)/Cell wall-active antibiotics response 4TMS YvqF